MATIAQLRANQLNAQKSTGPKTPEGKARCSQNATKHGLTAKTTVVLHEDAAEFEDLKQLLIEEFNPPTRWMTIQVEYLAHHWWKVLRTARTETGMWNKLLIGLADADGMQNVKDIDCDEGMGCLFDRTPKPIELQRRYTATIERAYYKQLALVERPDSPRVAKKRRDHANEQYRSRQSEPQAAAAGASARFDALLAKAEAIVDGKELGLGTDQPVLGAAKAPCGTGLSVPVPSYFPTPVVEGTPASSPAAIPEPSTINQDPEPPAHTSTPEPNTDSVNPSPSLPPSNPTQPQENSRKEEIGSVSQFPPKTTTNNPAQEAASDR